MTKSSPSLPTAAALPSGKGHRAAQGAEGKDPVWHHPLSLHLREGEEHPISPSRDSPGHLHPLPLAFFPFAPFPSHHPALQPLFPHLQTFCIPKKLLGEGEKKEKKSSFCRTELQSQAVEERSKAASHPQPALQHRWPKASVTSPVKRGLEQRGSWGLKCSVSADRRLCWISTVHAPNGNLSLPLASILGVCFPSGRLPCSSNSNRDFFPVSAAPLSPTVTGGSRRGESFGVSQGVPGKRSPTRNLTLKLTQTLALTLILTPNLTVTLNLTLTPTLNQTLILTPTLTTTIILTQTSMLILTSTLILNLILNPTIILKLIPTLILILTPTLILILNFFLTLTLILNLNLTVNLTLNHILTLTLILT